MEDLGSERSPPHQDVFLLDEHADISKEWSSLVQTGEDGLQDLHLFNPELLLPSPPPHTSKDPSPVKGRYPCSFCGKDFHFQSKLSRHLLSHSKTKGFNCISCNKNFSRADVLRLHALRVHGISEVVDRVRRRLIPCPKCPASLKSQKTLERHLRSHESRIGTFSCSTCSKDFFDKRKYQMHLRLHSNLPQKGFLIRGSHVCSFCSKTFSQSGGLSKHINRFHVKAVFYPCPLCEKSFSTSHQLKIHSRYHLQTRPYPCSICDSSFVEKGHLDRHIRRRHGMGLRPFRCSSCDKAFFEKYELNHHYREAHAGGTD